MKRKIILLFCSFLESGNPSLFVSYANIKTQALQWYQQTHRWQYGHLLLQTPPFQWRIQVRGNSSVYKEFQRCAKWRLAREGFSWFFKRFTFSAIKKQRFQQVSEFWLQYIFQWRFKNLTGINKEQFKDLVSKVGTIRTGCWNAPFQTENRSLFKVRLFKTKDFMVSFIKNI